MRAATALQNAKKAPSTFAGHSMLCPYDEKTLKHAALKSGAT
jgi:hypothetical protein